ncbi:prolyl 4-hydroxylase subunit alpha-2 [Drosophila busckii]|uniref:prolyl 4-hydroxylase subunit alpha-2 n=1 Tax=Drosophila busckii TaxID=30019 RepID=UPI00143340A1|nr:prolyl 4-hydroxylase subunit alpha-2 [Drosophila busckii]
MTWLTILLHIWLLWHATCGTTTEQETIVYSNSVAKIRHQQFLNYAINKMKKRPRMKSYEAAEEYVANPLNALALLRRLQQDWPKWLKYIKADSLQLEQMEERLKQAPSKRDLRNAVSKLLHLENFYDLETSHMIKGLLLEQQYDAQLDSVDCFALGNYLFRRNAFSRSTHWYRNAIRIYKEPYSKIYSKVYGVKLHKIYRQYARAIANETYILEKPKDKSTQEWAAAGAIVTRLVEDAKNKDIKRLIEQYLAGDEQIFIKDRARLRVKPTQLQSACRAESQTPSSSNLYCRYDRESSAFLKLAALKIEMLRLQPAVKLFHQVLHDKEIATLKQWSKEQTNWSSTSAVKSYALPADQLRLVDKLNSRIADMMQLDIAKHQELHLLNYGLGAHLGDPRCKSNSKSKHVACQLQGNYTKQATSSRQATMLFAASTVPLGGAVVFPKMQLTLKLPKGSALFWSNLNAIGKRDALANYVICPVLVGSRWALSKCINERPNRLCLA